MDAKQKIQSAVAHLRAAAHELDEAHKRMTEATSGVGSGHPARSYQIFEPGPETELDLQDLRDRLEATALSIEQGLKGPVIDNR